MRFPWGLGQTANERQQYYRELFRYQVDGELLNDIRKAANKPANISHEKVQINCWLRSGANKHE